MTVREHLLEALADADRLLAQDLRPLTRESLEAFRQDIKDTLALEGAKRNGTGPAPMIRIAAAPQPRIKGSVSMTQAVKEVLQEAHGEPMHVVDILAKAQAKGAITESSDPANSTDILLSKFRKRDHLPVERTAPRTWKWVSPMPQA